MRIISPLFFVFNPETYSTSVSTWALFPSAIVLQNPSPHANINFSVDNSCIGVVIVSTPIRLVSRSLAGGKGGGGKGMEGGGLATGTFTNMSNPVASLCMAGDIGESGGGVEKNDSSPKEQRGEKDGLGRKQVSSSYFVL